MVAGAGVAGVSAAAPAAAAAAAAAAASVASDALCELAGGGADAVEPLPVEVAGAAVVLASVEEAGALGSVVPGALGSRLLAMWFSLWVVVVKVLRRSWGWCCSRCL